VLPAGQTFLLILYTKLFYIALFRSLHCSAKREALEYNRQDQEFLLSGKNHLIPKCWGLVLKCYELRTRQHKVLSVNVLRP
jgi:hypothetical protein